MLAGTILLVVVVSVILAVVGASWLNQYWLLHFPLGFYLLAQGLLIFVVLASFFFVRAQDSIDRARSENEDLG
jgi:putative solute:sodium symporter small subunit